MTADHVAEDLNGLILSTDDGDFTCQVRDASLTESEPPSVHLELMLLPAGMSDTEEPDGGYHISLVVDPDHDVTDALAYWASFSSRMLENLPRAMMETGLGWGLLQMNAEGEASGVSYVGVEQRDEGDEQLVDVVQYALQPFSTVDQLTTLLRYFVSDLHNRLGDERVSLLLDEAVAEPPGQEND